MVSMTIIHKVIAILVSFFIGQLAGFGNPEVPGSNPAGGEIQSNFFHFPKFNNFDIYMHFQHFFLK